MIGQISDRKIIFESLASPALYLVLAPSVVPHTRTCRQVRSTEFQDAQVVRRSPSKNMVTTFHQPPCTPAEPVIDVVHGIEITDPYRWLEDQNSTRTRQWIEEQTRFTQAYLDAIPYRDRIRRRVVDLLATQVVSDPWRVVVGRIVCVKYSRGLSNRIELFSKSGSRLQMLQCPSMGQVHLLRRPVESTHAFYEYSSLTQAATIFCHDTVHGGTRIWSQTRHAIDLSQVYAEEISYESADGVSIPMLVFSKKESSHGTARPGFLTAYGGFGSSSIPQFSAFYAQLLECGILVAIALVRGGGELGVDWHRAGRRHNRRRSIDDFIAAAEWLFKANYVQPSKLAIGGASNGGLLALAALTRRPDLFRTALCIGPLSDMLRYQHFDSADRWVEEYGHAGNPQDFPHLLSYSPYHNVKDGVKYPSVLIVSGDADTRCNGMHARKMVARLQSASSIQRAMLDYKSIWGHTPAQPLTGKVDAITNRLAFLFHELGLEAINHTRLQ